MLQLEMEQYDYYKNWLLSKWIYYNKNCIASIVSLNYELHLERTLNAIGVDFKRQFTNESSHCTDRFVKIYKPHGSIDFDLLDFAIYCPDELRWSNIINGNISRAGNTFQNIVPKKRWLIPRLQSDIIPPSRSNNLLEYSWIKETYNTLKEDMKSIDCLINMGFSYSEADREEYNAIIKNWNSEKRVVIDFNRDRNSILEQFLKENDVEYRFVCLNLPWRILDYI